MTILKYKLREVVFVDSRGGVLCRPDVGFTLVELVTALAILAILAGILIPTVGSVRRSAQTAESKSNLRQLVVANLNHAAANNGVFAYATNEENDKRWCAAKVGGKWDRTKGYLSPYLGNDHQAAVCPLLEDMLPEGVDSFEEGTGGYGYNSSYIGGTEGDFMGRPSARLSQIKEPSRTVMFATTAYAREGGVQEYPFAEPPFWVVNGRVSSSRPSPTVHFRANGQAIVGWADGHVSLVEPWDRPHGWNPHGGDSEKEKLGWFGTDENNGFWNPDPQN